MQLGVSLIGSDQQDFLNRLHLAIGRELDPAVAAFSARRQDLDNQKRIPYRLPPDFDRSTTCRDIGLEISIGPVGPYHACFDLRIAGTPSGQRAIDSSHQAHGEDPMHFRGWRHCDWKAANQLVMRFGAVVPAEKLL